MRFAYIIIIVILLSQPAYSLLNCTISNDTCINTDIYHMSNLTDAHAELYNESDYAYVVCCNESSSALIRAGATILHISSSTDAHAELSNESDYPNQISLGSNNGTITCAYGTSACPEACLGTISSNTDAHVGDCVTDPYPTYICCAYILPTAVTPPPPSSSGSSPPIPTANMTSPVQSVLHPISQGLNTSIVLIIGVGVMAALMFAIYFPRIKRWWISLSDEEREEKPEKRNIFTKVKRWWNSLK
jgi:hypothetical protein